MPRFKRPKLHIHSDCFKWGGSENMPGLFLQDKQINEAFDVSFSYRYSKEYEEGMRKWVPNSGDMTYGLENPIYSLRLPVTWFYKVKKYFPPIMALGYASAVVDIVKMTKLFRRIKPNILHINNGGYPGALSCNSAAIAGWLAGVPRITYFVCSTTSNPWWFRPMTWMVKRAVTTFLSASKYLRDHSRHLWKDGANPGWSVISNTIRPYPPLPREQVRQLLGIPDDEVVFLCMGDLVERKGFYRAIDAISNLSDIGTPRSLLIVGDGPEEEFLRTRAAERKGVCRFLCGPLPVHPYLIISACDVLVVPSVGEEDWPNVILIAMMYGKPIIASDILGFHEMVEHGHTGYLTTRDFFWWMTGLLDKDKRISMGARAKQRYEQKYRIDKIMNRYIELWNV